MDRSQDLKEFDNMVNKESQRVFVKFSKKGYLARNAQWWSLTDAEDRRSPAAARSRHKKSREFLQQVKRDLGVAAFYLCVFAISPTSLARMSYEEFGSKYRQWSRKSRDLSAFQQQAEEEFNSAIAESSRKRSAPTSELEPEPQASDNEPSPKRLRLASRPSIQTPVNSTEELNRMDQGDSYRNGDRRADGDRDGNEVDGEDDEIECEGDGEGEGGGEEKILDQNEEDNEDGDEDEDEDEDNIVHAQNPPGTNAPFAEGRSRENEISQLEATIAHLQPTIAHLDERTGGGKAVSIQYDQVVYILETMDIVRMAHEWGAVGVVRLTVPKDVKVAPFVTFSCSRKVVHQAVKHRQREQ